MIVAPWFETRGRCRAARHEEPDLVLGSIAAVHRERE